MDKDGLQRVIDVENAIQQHLADEKRKAATWLETVRQTCEQEVAGKKRELEQIYLERVKQAETDARRQGEEIFAKTARDLRILEKLTAEVVRTTVLKHLAGIIPGAADDPENVKGGNYRHPSFAGGCAGPGQREG